MKKIITGIILLLATVNSFALRVEISNDTFATTGRNSNRNLFVTNNSEKMVALEVYAQKRMVDTETGQDLLEDVEDFLIYPNQLLLQPEEQQVVTLTWVGEQEIEEEKAFRVIVEELNLSLDEQEAGADGEMTVKVAALTKVVKAVYVAPDGAKPNIKIIGSKVTQSEDGKKMIEVTFENSGTMHKLMKQTKITVVPVDSTGSKVASGKVSYVPVELDGIINILSKSQRVLTVSLPEGMDESYSEFDVSL